MKRLLNLPSGFAVLMIAIGVTDLTRPESFKLAMDQIQMPHYILWILGFAKALGGIVLLLASTQRLREWAYVGFFIWALGGISAHVFSGHGMREMMPLLSLTCFLIFACHLNSKVR